ncbi:MAG TPA: hypothetical protein VJ553_07115, partial [Candidatus Paceibacterota bacterium]|nr:hypothetical protein [Candidatus Paceibacterota bacterium]
GGPASLSQDETLTGNWVNTAFPWADNEVADDITAANYLPLAGGTLTGDLFGTNASFSGNLEVTGTVTGSNLNIADWDTAYGWGDHATFGYVTTTNSNIPFLTFGNTASLDFERSLTGTANQVILTDGGANGSLTLSLSPDLQLTNASVSGSFEAAVASVSQLYIAGSAFRALTSDSLDFDELVDNMTLDTNLSVASAGYTTTWNGNTYFMQGNVGIGTTTLGQKLVVGNITAQNTLRINGLDTTNMAPVLSLFKSGSVEWTIAPVGTSLVIAANPANYTDAAMITAGKMTILNTGNVGIGTTDPRVSLDVRSGAVGVKFAATTLDSMASGLIVGPEQPVASRFGFGINGGLYYQGGSGNDNFDFRAKTADGSYGTVNVRIQDNGNVGIGTTSPTTTLDVSGSASISGNFELTGTVSSNWIPTIDNAYSLGTSALRWSNLFATNASVSSTLEAGIASVSQ